MGSQAGGSNAIGGTGTGTHDPKPYPLTREGSLYSLTLDEVQNQLGDLGKPLSSMNLDELLKNVWIAEAANNSQAVEGVDCVQPALNGQSPFLRDLSNKTVEEVWKDIQQGQKMSSLDRKETLGEMTLEDFLVKAGIVADSPSGKKSLGSVIGAVDGIGLCQQGQWMCFPTSSSVHPQQQQQHSLISVYNPVPGNPVIDVAYPETQIAMSSSPLMGTLSDTQTPRRKRAPPLDIAERSVERRQKRMIKNRESAARSRARKQAYTHELENKVSRLEEENERLKRLQELEKALPSVPPPEPKYQLRRTSSAPI